MKGILTIALSSDLNPICQRLILRYVKDNDAQFLLKKDITIKSLDEFCGFIDNIYRWNYEMEGYVQYWYHCVNFNIFCAEMIKKHKWKNTDMLLNKTIKRARKFYDYASFRNGISQKVRHELLNKIEILEKQ